LTEYRVHGILRGVKGPPNRLRVLRAERDDISQLDTALATGIAKGRYWRIENGYDIPTQKERTRLAKFFRVSESDVFPVPHETRA
jgi:transcriptional regulator with XRE-family HTH domain